MVKSKFGAIATSVDNLKFDSKIEARYYEYLLDLMDKGLVVSFALQPAFNVIPSFTDPWGMKHRKNDYVADFLVVYADGSMKLIDIKGMETTDFKIKRKLYCMQYPIELLLISYSKIDGGWIELSQLKKNRLARKKAKKAKK